VSLLYSECVNNMYPSPLSTYNICFKMNIIFILYTTFHCLKPIESLSTKSINQPYRPYRIGVIGGGASGMFAATNAASRLHKYYNTNTNSNNPDHQLNHKKRVEVHVYETTNTLMSKVLISGGGRCNVLHDTAKPVTTILESYPRGNKELNGLFHKHFTPLDARAWFEDRHVVLKTESDGRMFPITDDSNTIMDCIYKDAKKNGVIINTESKVYEIEKVKRDDDGGDGDGDDHGDDSSYYFAVKTKTRKLKDNASERTENEQQSTQNFPLYDCIIMATGSSPMGHEIIRNLNVGHQIVKPVPSLFTFNAAKHQIKEQGSVLYDLAGLSLKHSKLTLKVAVPGKKKKKIITQEGPLLITHTGISGPATLRLSAFAAREFHSMNYKTQVMIHWAPELGSVMEIEEKLWSMTTLNPKKLISSSYPLTLRGSDSTSSSKNDESSSPLLPRRLWSALVLQSGIEQDRVWGEAPKKKVNALARNIAEFALDVAGKSVFKDEFVTAGGIMLKEIKMQTMESKKCSGLFFCGEVIDVDGITGGFNFMNCWSTGYTAGTCAASTLIDRIETRIKD